MATKEQQKAFIEQIGPMVQQIGPGYGIKCYSAVIAQACLESAYGTSSKAQHHNYFGLKYRKNRVTCNSGYFKDGSKEERSGGQLVNISDYWYAFEDMAHGVEGYFQFINISNYANVKGITDPETYLANIKKDGYATASDYVKNNLSVIKNHDLTRFDNCAGAISQEEKALEIIKNSKFWVHNTGKRSKKIEYIVVHYTASVADAPSQISYFNSSKANNSSADFFVAWDGTVYQYNPDLQSRYSWAVGGGRQSAYGGTYYGKCYNGNSVSIEMCCKSKTGKYVGANNAAWYFTAETIEGTVQLVRKLMSDLGIDADHVIRHYDVNGKLCPGIKGWNAPSGSETTWKAFKSRIRSAEQTEQKTEETAEAAADESQAQKAETPFLVKVEISTLRIRKGPGTNYGIVKYIPKGIYTIVEIYGNWGKLKSGLGWICLDYARRV